MIKKLLGIINKRLGEIKLEEEKIKKAAAKKKAEAKKSAKKVEKPKVKNDTKTIDKHMQDANKKLAEAKATVKIVKTNITKTVKPSFIEKASTTKDKILTALTMAQTTIKTANNAVPMFKFDLENFISLVQIPDSSNEGVSESVMAFTEITSKLGKFKSLGEEKKFLKLSKNELGIIDTSLSKSKKNVKKSYEEAKVSCSGRVKDYRRKKEENTRNIYRK